MLSPVYWAGASLKCQHNTKHSYKGRISFPGLLGRGLIEVLRLARDAHDPVDLSPVYWAGASLKSLVREGSSSADRLFPRSTGPGPH